MSAGFAIDEHSAHAGVRDGPAPEQRPTPALYLGLFFTTAGTLLLELTLTRIFDVVLFDNLAYLIVSSAIFGYALAAVCVMVSRLGKAAANILLPAAAIGFAVAVMLLFPAIGLIPADLNDVPTHPVLQIAAFGALYLCMLLPFFAAGVAVSTIVTREARHIHGLYFCDLSGAAIGCLGILFLPSALGGEETLFVVAACGALAAACFSAPRSSWRKIIAVVALALLALAGGLRNRIEFPSLVSKRGVRLGRGAEQPEFSRWDPVSKVDVLRTDKPFALRIAYDGGSQSSMLLAFDGDYAALQRNYFELVQGSPRYSGKYLALSHWLKRGRAPVTLVIGSAGGSETLAALAWGASHVDAVEMVCTVVALAKGRFGAFIGHIFDDPRVDLRCDEGRSFLERTNRVYDIIQMHSAHTTSSIANGAGGTMPVYLQTVEAYREYFRHLSPDGILQINYFAYLRMLTTAAQAWHELFPSEDFRRHLVITTGYGPMPTFLVKRSIWSPEEISSIREFLGGAIPDNRPYRLIYAPGVPEERNVPQEFFATPLDPALVARLPYRILPPTDDRPFFRDLRKRTQRLEADAKGYVTEDIVEYLNSSLRRFQLPMEFVHLYFLGGLAILVASVLILVPLVWRRQDLARREAPAALVYFMCLGAGFVLVELTLMSKLLVLVGFPVYAMATVLFTLLLSAGVGSYLSSGLSRVGGRAAALAIGLFAVAIVGLIIAFPWLRDATLEMGIFPRAVVAGALVIPFGIPLGMPFPLGIAALEKRAPQLIPWAWAANGFMTVVGSLVAPLLSMKLGFDATLAVGGAIYLVALASYPLLTHDRAVAR